MNFLMIIQMHAISMRGLVSSAASLHGEAPGRENLMRKIGIYSTKHQLASGSISFMSFASNCFLMS